jgi:hypothetical protein
VIAMPGAGGPRFTIYLLEGGSRVDAHTSDARPESTWDGGRLPTFLSLQAEPLATCRLERSKRSFVSRNLATWCVAGNT